LHGYARVSTADQNPDAQRDALLRAGVHPDQLYLDHTSGAKSSRPAWDGLCKALRAGDVLVATRLDRVGRSTTHLVSLLDQLAGRGVAFRFLEHGDAREKTVAEIAAIFTVPRTTIYGHLNNGSAGARPRARKPQTSVTAPAKTPDSAGSPTAVLRPKPARIPQTDEPPSVQERQLRDRLVRQREAMRASRCPACGNEPVDAQTQWQQRQDLTTVWLHLDGDELREQRHCVACQPHDQPMIIECDRCGDGPLVTGLPANTPIEKWPPALTRWLHNNGWRTNPEPRCGNHR
jgi:Resolvase, N terminal domain